MAGPPPWEALALLADDWRTGPGESATVASAQAASGPGAPPGVDRGGERVEGGADARAVHLPATVPINAS